MRCPNCQAINPITAKYCLECGKRFGVCPNCGTVNPPLAKFCIECGYALLPNSKDGDNRAVGASAEQPHAGNGEGSGRVSIPSRPSPMYLVGGQGEPRPLQSQT